MSISSNLQNAVEQKNIEVIREELRAKIPLDPTLTKGFAESLKYCLDNGIDVYESDDGRELPTENSADSFEVIVGMIQTNFSKEKLNALSNIALVVYGNTKKSSDSEPEKTNKKPLNDNKRIISRPHVSNTGKNTSDNPHRTSDQRESGNSDKESGGPSTTAILITAAAVAAVAVGAVLLFKKF